MGESYEYLVRGAQLKCDAGSKIMKLGVPTCHGVYAGQGAVIHQKDCVVGENILSFGSCKNKKNEPCTPIIVGDWMSTNNKTMIVQNGSTTAYPSVTMNSFLVCNLGGMIEPVKSGQVLSGGVTQVSYTFGTLLYESALKNFVRTEKDIKKMARISVQWLAEHFSALSLETLRSTKFDYWATSIISIGISLGLMMDLYGNAYMALEFDTGTFSFGLPQVGYGRISNVNRGKEDNQAYINAIQGFTGGAGIEVFVLNVSASFSINDLKHASMDFGTASGLGAYLKVNKTIHVGNIYGPEEV